MPPGTFKPFELAVVRVADEPPLPVTGRRSLIAEKLEEAMAAVPAGKWALFNVPAPAAKVLLACKAAKQQFELRRVGAEIWCRRKPAPTAPADPVFVAPEAEAAAADELTEFVACYKSNGQRSHEKTARILGLTGAEAVALRNTARRKGLI